MKTGKFLSEYLKSKDVVKPMTVTIQSVEVRAFTDQETKKERKSLAVSFKELDQLVVLCKASILQLTEILGSDETDAWIGKLVILFRDDSVQYKGKKIGGLRFKAA